MIRIRSVAICGIGVVVLVATGCMLVDKHEAPSSWNTRWLTAEDGKFVPTLALPKPKWYSSVIVDEHQRAFVQLIHEVRCQGLPVDKATLVSDTQVIAYGNKHVYQGPRCGVEYPGCCNNGTQFCVDPGLKCEPPPANTGQ